MERTLASWNDDLEAWLDPFVTALGHKARRQMGPACLSGLIGPGDRMSVQPMAALTPHSNARVARAPGSVRRDAPGRACPPSSLRPLSRR